MTDLTVRHQMGVRADKPMVAYFASDSHRKQVSKHQTATHWPVGGHPQVMSSSYAQVQRHTQKLSQAAKKSDSKGNIMQSQKSNFSIGFKGGIDPSQQYNTSYGLIAAKKPE